MADVDIFLDAIRAGDFDDELIRIIDTVKVRVRESSAKVCWRVELDGLNISEQSQTIAEAMSVERQTGKRWGQYHPATSALEVGAVVIAHLVEVEKLSLADAMKRLSSVTAEQMANAVSEYQPDDAGS